jgi:hypothetical protein
MPSRESLAHDVRFIARARDAAPAKPPARHGSLAAADDGSDMSKRNTHPPNTAAAQNQPHYFGI